VNHSGSGVDKSKGRAAARGYTMSANGTFAAYDPAARGERSTALRLRAASHRDIATIARLTAEREQQPLAACEASLRGEFDRIERNAARKYFCVAEIDGVIAGFGRATYLPIPDIPEARGMPAGWYLTGVIVDPSWRRRGIGHALTEQRMAWVAQHADAICYYASARNGPTIDLHAAFGFAELTRDFAFPGVDFTVGEGILFVRKLNRAQRVS
jgi:ribosomal protein S18 acetylase RimI-like enzyme